MTVAELIEKLREMPQDAMALIDYSASLPGETPVAKVEVSSGWYLPDGKPISRMVDMTPEAKIVTVLICDC